MPPDDETEAPTSGGLVKKSISLPDELYEAAQRRAAMEHRTFSSYIQFLIAMDTTAVEEHLTEEKK